MAFLPALGALAAAAAPALSLASGVVGAAGAVSAGMYQGQVAKNNAKIARMAADQEDMNGRQESMMQDRKVAAAMSEQKAQQGANNLDVDSGSTLAIRVSTRDLGTEDRQTLANNTAQRSWSLRTQAGQMEAEGKAQQASGYIDAVSSMLGGASGFASKWDVYKTKGVMKPATTGWY